MRSERMFLPVAVGRRSCCLAGSIQPVGGGAAMVKVKKIYVALLKCVNVVYQNHELHKL